MKPNANVEDRQRGSQGNTRGPGRRTSAGAQVVLEAANQQQQALLDRVGHIFTAIGPTTSALAAVFTTAAGATYGSTGTKTSLGSSAIDEAAKARLIVSKLDAAAHARLTSDILPKRASQVCCDGTVKTLKELLGYNFDYIGMVNRRHEMAESSAITPEQMKCVVWFCGLHTTDDADIRTRTLRKMEDNPQTTRSELSLEDCCKNFASEKKRNLKKRRTTNNVVVIASTGTDVAQVSRIYRKVKINGATVQMCLDTGADVILLSVKDWIKINRPKLLAPLVKLKSANNKDIKVRGYFECNFDTDGHKERGNCYVADTQSLLGIDWIVQKTSLYSEASQKTPSARCLPEQRRRSRLRPSSSHGRNLPLHRIGYTLTLQDLSKEPITSSSCTRIRDGPKSSR
ncbi:unnamed protein product [Toxocara canis]|uniref:Peptidase A2 domain-containing protein n=1 Tax=Toxocara canis TaxID=6265 RepID=A0A183V9G7_TOXCA|nr:unnamed protein product [Toxocara canis]